MTNSRWTGRIAHVFSGADVLNGSRQAFFRAVFFAPLGSGTYNTAGIQDLLIRIHHKPQAETFEPFEVAYNWTEHRESGDLSRSHSELVTKLPYQYKIKGVVGLRHRETLAPRRSGSRRLQGVSGSSATSG